MNPRPRAVALYGRFSPGVRDRLQQQIVRDGGAVTRDMTRRSELVVVGAQAFALIDSGALAVRVAAGQAGVIRLVGEQAFLAELAGDTPDGDATLPLATALGQTGLTIEDARILAAFDLVTLIADHVRFGDAAILRTAGELTAHGRSLGEAVRILARARQIAPRGRHRIVLTPAGEAALQWQDGLTTLEGQGLLAIDEDHVSIDDLFEAAAQAQADGDDDEAARLYDMSARADRADAIAPYNLGNIRLGQGAHDQAVLAYQRALARDAGFLEARYNLAQALEAAGKPAAAEAELARLLDADPAHADAVFNLAQLRMKAGDMAAAKTLYERYLTLDPPESWAATARKAILYCAGQGA
jgi:hypothetical protein